MVVAGLRKANGDWTLDAERLVVTCVKREPELHVLATDARGRAWDFMLGNRATAGEPNLVGEKVSDVVASAAGELRLEFGDGTALNVSPLDDAEAWEIRCEGESVLLGAPTGGGVIAF